MKIIILGCGRVGATLATMLSSEGDDVIVIDKNSDSFRRLGKEFNGNKIVGNAIDVEVLVKAGIEEADTFISTTNGDNTNIMTAQIAKNKFKVKNVLCRIYDPIRAKAYSEEVGLKTFCPTTIGANILKDMLKG
jgi:trk system potassium uptake protein TrkA